MDVLRADFAQADVVAHIDETFRENMPAGSRLALIEVRGLIRESFKGGLPEGTSIVYVVASEAPQRRSRSKEGHIVFLMRTANDGDRMALEALPNASRPFSKGLAKMLRAIGGGRR